MHTFNDTYTDEHLDEIALPLGGIGASMVCLTGRGNLKHISLRHHPDLNGEPFIFAALHARDTASGDAVIRIVERAPDGRTVLRPSRRETHPEGFPKFAEGSFTGQFPFGELSLQDPSLPGLEVNLTGWSPFIPGDSDRSSLPMAGLEYRFTNSGESALELTFSWHAENIMSRGGRIKEGEVKALPHGAMLYNPPEEDNPSTEGAFMFALESPESVAVNHRWFRGGWFDAPTAVFESIREGAMPGHEPVGAESPSRGASAYTRIRLEAGESKTIAVRLSWYVPRSNLNHVPAEIRKQKAESCGCGEESEITWPTHEPFYASLFDSPEDVAAAFARDYTALRAESAAFRDAFFQSTLAPEVLEAVSANLAILKSPTVLRQKDGKLWAWEGSSNSSGCCHGSCTHVWGYAQALPHLFPDLERTLRETEYEIDQDDTGHQDFRAALPIDLGTPHTFHAALDGQLGGIMKVYREWRLCGDTGWMRRLYPRIKESLDYCQRTFDPDRTGTIVEPHHNTYDIEFWGPNGMIASYYLGAIAALIAMGEHLGEAVEEYRKLLTTGRNAMETELWDGDMFIQKVIWTGLRADDPVEYARSGIGGSNFYSPEALELLEKEGPRYQYGPGCISDGVLGEFLAWASGMEPVLDSEKVRGHLQQVHEHNYKESLAEHLCPQRWHYALSDESGLLLCSWPKGGKPLLPFPYSDEVWTGIEYQVAAHLIAVGDVEPGLEIVRAARKRYDGARRNPFDEVECGHWYARALSSYALLQALTGIRYDAVENKLHFAQQIDGDFTSFFAANGGFGLAGIRDGKPFFEMVRGNLPDPEIVVAG